MKYITFVVGFIFICSLSYAEFVPLTPDVHDDEYICGIIAQATSNILSRFDKGMYIEANYNHLNNNFTDIPSTAADIRPLVYRNCKIKLSILGNGFCKLDYSSNNQYAKSTNEEDLLDDATHFTEEYSNLAIKNKDTISERVKIHSRGEIKASASMLNAFKLKNLLKKFRETPTDSVGVNTDEEPITTLWSDPAQWAIKSLKVNYRNILYQSESVPYFIYSPFLGGVGRKYDLREVAGLYNVKSDEHFEFLVDEKENLLKWKVRYPEKSYYVLELIVMKDHPENIVSMIQRYNDGSLHDWLTVDYDEAKKPIKICNYEFKKQGNFNESLDFVKSECTTYQEFELTQFTEKISFDDSTFDPTKHFIEGDIVRDYIQNQQFVVGSQPNPSVPVSTSNTEE